MKKAKLTIDGLLLNLNVHKFWFSLFAITILIAASMFTPSFSILFVLFTFRPVSFSASVAWTRTFPFSVLFGSVALPSAPIPAVLITSVILIHITAAPSLTFPSAPTARTGTTSFESWKLKLKKFSEICFNLLKAEENLLLLVSLRSRGDLDLRLSNPEKIWVWISFKVR